jgi:hypothetical protein
VYQDALLQQVAGEIIRNGGSLTFPPIPTGGASLLEFRKGLQQAGSSLTDDDINFLFTRVATVNSQSFSQLLTARQKVAALDVSSLPAESLRLLQVMAKAVDASNQSVAQCFQQIDSNQDGKITFDELKTAVVKLESKASGLFGGGAPNQQALQHLFAMMDTSCDGTISLREFGAALVKAKQVASLATQGGAPTGPRVDIKITRHVYNARGGAPPYRGSYLTATDEVILDGNVLLANQKHKLVPASGAPPSFGMAPSPEMYILPAAASAPQKWEDQAAPGIQKVDFNKKAADAFGTNFGIDFGISQLVVLIPMMGMD